MDFDEKPYMAKKNHGTGTLPFKDILSALMKERRLTVKQVASLAGVAPSVIQNWIEGKSPHDLQAVGQLSLKLGIPFKKLLLGVDEAVDLPSNINALFDERELFDGIVRLKVTKLDSKKKE